MARLRRLVVPRPVAVLALLVLIPVFRIEAQEPDRSGTVHGFVREASTGEPVAGAIVAVEGLRSVVTSREGYFSLAGIGPGSHRLRVTVFGFAPVDTLVEAGTRPVEILLERLPFGLDPLVVEVDRPVAPPAVSVETVTRDQIRRVPAALEADVFRALQALPGVVAPNILSSRLLVRGGEADQNLFMLDGYPIIYPHHLGGGFSAFHVDAVQDVNLWLAVPPARYGGALSSVLDIGLREGNREELTGTASLGLVTSSAVVEGPHPAGAWFVGARRTYLDQISRVGNRRFPYHFYDVYAKSYAELSPSDRLSILAFFGRDRLWSVRTGGPAPPPGTETPPREELWWQNGVFGATWRHLFGGDAVLEQRLSFSTFSQQLHGARGHLQQGRPETTHEVDLLTAAGQFRWMAPRRHEIEVGYTLEQREERHRTSYAVRFGGMPPMRIGGGQSARAVTAALYVQDDVTLTDAFRVRLGLRAESVGEHGALLPRVAARYRLTERLSILGGWGLHTQHDHLLQDPDAPLSSVYSVDIWHSAHETGVPLPRSTHAVAGVEATLPGSFHARAEAYVKTFDGLLTISPHDPSERLAAVERLEHASGRASGIDLTLRREGIAGPRGWIGYSFATSSRAVEVLSFPADRHPRQRAVAVLDARRRGWRLTGRFDAQEGIPYTPALGTIVHRPYDFGFGSFTGYCPATDVEYLYGQRNGGRTGWSKRLDIGGHYRKVTRRGWAWEFSFSVLNVLFDPPGVFRPSEFTLVTGEGCSAPIVIQAEPELILPAVPSISIRIEF